MPRTAQMPAVEILGGPRVDEDYVFAATFLEPSRVNNFWRWVSLTQDFRTLPLLSFSRVAAARRIPDPSCLSLSGRGRRAASRGG